MSTVINEVIEIQSRSLPLYLRSFRIDVHYCAGMFPNDERRETVEEAFAELQKAIQLGFFCWDYFPDREAAKVTLAWHADSHMAVDFSGNGVHYNALVATILLIVNLHHSSRGTYESLKALLGDDINALPKPTTFRENVASVIISEIDSVGQRVVSTRDILSYIENGITFPAYPPLQTALNEDFADNNGMELERLIITSPFDDAFPPKNLRKIEDYFLRIAASGIFTSTDKLDRRFRDDEAEIFKRKRGGVTQLLFGDYQEQKYGVIEFLNVVSGGDLTRLVVRDENDG